MLNIVLVEPEIPQNTGNIIRTCAVTGCELHLVRPLGFELTDARLKRAGLDYFPMAKIHFYDDMEEFFARNPGRYFFFSTKAKARHSDVAYRAGDYILFGKESAGLPEELLAAHYDACVRIPMRAGCRSLNLSNSVAVAVYEALRQQDYAGLETAGNLTVFTPNKLPKGVENN